MDRVTPKQRSANMRAIRSKGMKPEMKVRRLVHGMGYRYRLHRHKLPGRPDMVFSSRHKVIFVHGCFWHQHDSATCKIAHISKSNREYWVPKLERNRARDAEHQQRLRELGWDILAVWECELKDEAKLANRLAEFLDERNRGQSQAPGTAGRNRIARRCRACQVLAPLAILR